MNNFYNQENACTFKFKELGACYHLWTPENFEIIFTSEAEFKQGMNIIGLCAALFPDIIFLTFELMSNHLHIVLSGNIDRIIQLFAFIKKYLSRHTRLEGKNIQWNDFHAKYRKIETLEDLRNVIIYTNRNGFVAHSGYTPYSYPWGANRYYFNDDAQKLASFESVKMSFKEKRQALNSHDADNIGNIKTFDGYVLPLDFCHIKDGEALFRNASHYFNKLSKSIECDKLIAKEIGESIFYSDDELYGVISKLCKEQYNNLNPSSVKNEQKIALAKIMRFDYNASSKQIGRILKLSAETMESLGIKTPDKT